MLMLDNANANANANSQESTLCNALYLHLHATYDGWMHELYKIQRRNTLSNPQGTPQVARCLTLLRVLTIESSRPPKSPAAHHCTRTAPCYPVPA